MNIKSNAAESKCESVKGKPDVPPGARVYMRSDEEMAVLDKKAADAAFKKQNAPQSAPWAEEPPTIGTRLSDRFIQ